MTSFTDIFGGNAIDTAQPSFLSLNPLTASTVLQWPLEQTPAGVNVVASIINVNATAASLTISLSDARQTSTGYTAIFNNIGSNTFNVLDASGGVLAVIASGTAWLIYLADNSTLAGSWGIFQLGAGVSSANAAALAGAGLKAITTTLNERIAINAQSANYVIVNADRASCVEWTDGNGTFTLPSPGTVGADWFCIIKNSGTGALTVTPPSGTIDTQSSLTFNPDNSAFVVCDGTNFFTVGLGQAINSIFDFDSVDVSGSGDYVLSGANLNRISYRFTGVLTGARNVIVPTTIQQYWVDNETTGAFGLTVKTATGTGISISQGARNILYCDGTNIVVAVTFGSAGYPNGSAASPSIFFAASPTTGIFSGGTNLINFSTNGVQRGQIDNTGKFFFDGPDDASTAGITFNQSAAAAGITVKVVSPFSSAAANPLLQLQSIAANGFATLSISGNGATAGATDLSVFQNGATGEGQVLNRHATGHLKLGANSIVGVDIDQAGNVSFPVSFSLSNVIGNLPVANLNGGSGASASTYWRGDDTWAAIPAAPTAANPTSVIGLGVNNGVLGTYMRSDAAPPLNQAITPTWTQPHVFNNVVSLNNASSTATTQAVGDSSTKIATTGFANPSFNNAAIGHAELPGGLILNFGQVTAGSGNNPTQVAVTFDKPFTSACYGVVVTANKTLTPTATIPASFVNSITLTGANIVIDNESGNPSAYLGYYWAWGT